MWVVGMELMRVMLYVAQVMLFALRMWTATLYRITRGMSSQTLRAVRELHQLRILMIIVKGIQSQGTFLTLSTVTILCICFNYMCIMGLSEGGNVIVLLGMAGFGGGVEIVFINGVGISGRFSEMGKEFVEGLKRVECPEIGEHWGWRHFKMEINAVPCVKFPASIGEFTFFHCVQETKTICMRLILDHTISLLLL